MALTVQEYEQLVASRRQIGGQSARVRVLAQQVKRDARLLQELEVLVGCPGHDGTDSACLRCTIAALLRRHREETR
ncbi:hypothetical protein Scel_05680 [Streptomyces cellostaticus]|nr:hypothetical protein Scel_05680 [Streptomyces cellostaticus]